MTTRLLEMLDIEARGRAVDAITDAVAAAFRQDRSRQTQAEIKRRFNLCLGLVGVMRNDLRWSWARIHDELPVALRMKLEGGDWVPSSRSAWYADPSTGLILPP